MDQYPYKQGGRWWKPCASCGELQSYLRHNYAVESLRLGKECKKCSNKHAENCHRGWHRGIRISWFNKFKTSAETRGIDWDLSLDDVADIMDDQGCKCALTGWDITFPATGHPDQSAASIDRIDSSLSYTRGNVQIVERRVNMMKGKYTQDEFIAVCCAVASNQEVKW